MARRALPVDKMVLVHPPSTHKRLRAMAHGNTILAQVFKMLPKSPIESF
jgi:hypothetical protein